MPAYSLQFKSSVEKDLRRLEAAVLRRVWAQVKRLATEPFPRQAMKLSGAERLYRLRVGDYRIIYEVEVEKKTVVLHYVRHRRSAYRGL